MGGWIILFFIGLLLLFGISFFLSGNDLLSPTVVVTLGFLFATFLAILNIDKWDIDFSIRSAGILLSGLGVYVAVGHLTMVFRPARKNRPSPAQQEIFHPVDIHGAIALFAAVFCILFTFLYYREIVAIAGSVREGYYGNFISVYRTALNDGYFENGTGMNKVVSIGVRVTECFAYFFLYIFLKNKVRTARKAKQMKRKEWILLVPALCFIINSLLNGARYYVLAILSFALICTYIFKQQRNAWNYQFRWKTLCKGIFFIFLGLLAFYYISFMIGRYMTTGIFDYVSNYFGGPIYLFDEFVASNPQKAAIFGEETFVDFLLDLDNLGILSSPMRNVHLPFMRLGAENSGNVYTFFRRPLHDFGYMGMLLYTAIVSTAVCSVYNLKIKTRPAGKADLWVLLYGFYFIHTLLASYDCTWHSTISHGRISVAVMLCLLNLFFTKVKVRGWKLQFARQRAVRIGRREQDG